MPQIFNNNTKPIHSLGRTKSTLYLTLHQKRMQLIRTTSNLQQNKKLQKTKKLYFQKDESSLNYIDKNLQIFEQTLQTQTIKNYRPNNIQRALQLQKQISLKSEALKILKKQLQGLKVSRQQIQLSELTQIDEIQANISLIQTYCQQSLIKKQNIKNNLIQIQTLDEQLKFIKSNQIRRKTLAKNNLELKALESLALNKQILQIKSKIKVKSQKKSKISQLNQKIQKLKSIKHDSQQYLSKIAKMNQQKFTKAKTIIEKGIKKELMYYKQQHVDYLNQTIKYIQMALKQLYSFDCEQNQYKQIRDGLKMLAQNNLVEREDKNSRLQKLILEQHQIFFKDQLVELNLPPQFMKSSNVQQKQDSQQKLIQKQQFQVMKNLQSKEAVILKLIMQSQKLSQQIRMKECQSKNNLQQRQFK